MDGHIIVYSTDKPYSAHCSCEAWAVYRLEHKWQVEDEANIHLDNVRRVRAANNRQPSLRQIAKHYRHMAETQGDDRISELWTALAEEIEDRLASKSLSDEGQDPLF